MTPAMEPCLRAPKKARGAHNLCVLIPNKPKHPATLFCDRCGATKQVRLTHAGSLDDLSAADIEAMVRHG